MKVETAVMERFVEIIQNNERLADPSHNRLQVYRDMVHFRFVETLENIYPLLTANLGSERMHELIREFIAHGARNPFIVKMAQEFGNFLRHHPAMKGYGFLEDLLWFEYGELDLLSRKFDHTHTTLQWDRGYRLSPSALVRSLNYRIHTGELESPCVSSLLLYYHFGEDRVYYEETTPFAQQLIEKLETLTLQRAVRVLAEMYELEMDVLRDNVEQLMQKWCRQRILIHYTEVENV